VLPNHDRAVGGEPGAPVVRRITSAKDAALEAATAAGLQVLTGRYSVHKYEGSVAPENLREIVECPPNLFLTNGVNRLWNLASVAATTPKLDASNSYLGVGNSSAAGAGAAETDLLGALKLRKLVNVAPVISGNQITFSSQFGTSDANFEWLEVCVAWASTGANTLISRSTIATPGLGTKVNTAVWVLNWTLSIS
jgi:hypothetical protein